MTSHLTNYKGTKQMLIDNYTIVNIKTFKDYNDTVFYKRIFKDNGANPLLFFYMRRLLNLDKEN